VRFWGETKDLEKHGDGGLTRSGRGMMESRERKRK
jgi:hypothetical protein